MKKSTIVFTALIGTSCLVLLVVSALWVPTFWNYATKHYKSEDMVLGILAGILITLIGLFATLWQTERYGHFYPRHKFWPIVGFGVIMAITSIAWGINKYNIEHPPAPPKPILSVSILHNLAAKNTNNVSFEIENYDDYYTDGNQYHTINKFGRHLGVKAHTQNNKHNVTEFEDNVLARAFTGKDLQTLHDTGTACAIVMGGTLCVKQTKGKYTGTYTIKEGK